MKSFFDKFTIRGKVYLLVERKDFRDHALKVTWQRRFLFSTIMTFVSADTVANLFTTIRMPEDICFVKYGKIGLQARR